MAALRVIATRVCRSAVTAPSFVARAAPKRAFALGNASQRLSPMLSHTRAHSTPSNAPKAYNFNDVKSAIESPSSDRVIIDVREPSEYAEGYIPGAINIPVKSQPDAIFLPEEEFEDKFGFSKPAQDQEVLFYCRAGVRSSAAAQLAQQQGYTRISEYRGSWLDWEKNGGEIDKP